MFLVSLLLGLGGCSSDRATHYAVDEIIAPCTPKSNGGTYAQRVDCCVACAKALKVSTGGAIAYWQSAMVVRIGCGAVGAVLAALSALFWRRRAARARGESRPPSSASAFLAGWFLLPIACVSMTTIAGEAWLSASELPRLLGAVEAARTLHRRQMHTFPEGTQGTSFACAATLNAAMEANACRSEAASFSGLGVELAPMPAESQKDDYRVELQRHVDDLRESALELRSGGQEKVYTEAELSGALPRTEVGVYEEIPLFRAVARSSRFAFVAGLPPALWALVPLALGLASAWFILWLRSRGHRHSIYNELVNLTPGQAPSEN